MLGLGLSIPQLATRGGRTLTLSQQVAALFANGEQGAWYDPSDYTTLFEDAAGTIPITSPLEKPVGLMLDKSKSGVGTNGAKRVNLLTKTEQFDDAVWSKTNATVTANAVVAPDGATSADKLIADSTNSTHGAYQLASVVSGVAYTFSVYLKKGEYSQCALGRSTGNGGLPSGGNFYIDLNDGSVVGSSSWTITVSYARTGWYRVTGTFTATSTSSADGPSIYIRNGLSTSFSGDGTSGIYIWGADLRVASEATTLPLYQKITDTWYNTMAGNHATQATTTSRPTLSARYNLLTKTEQFDDATTSGWGKSNTTVTANTTETVDPIGGNTADKLLETTGNTVHEIYTNTTNSPSIVNGITYRWSIYVKDAGRRYVGLFLSSYKIIVFDLTTVTVASTSSAGIGSPTGTIIDVGNGWRKCTYTITAVRTNPDFSGIGTSSTGSSYGPFVGDATKGLYIWGADLRVANDGIGLPAYQRVNTATDYDYAGFPPYLKFDGTDDWLVTPTITPNTDKVQVFAGVRKLSDAVRGAVASFGSGSTSRFQMDAPTASPNLYLFYVYGAGSGTAVYVSNSQTQYAGPISTVLTGTGDTNSSVVDFRINSYSVGTGSTMGGGNLMNAPLYIGSTSTPSIWFAGRLYSLIVRFGPTLTATQIANTETWVNSHTKAY